MVAYTGFGLSLMVLLIPFTTSFYEVVILFLLFGVFAGMFIVPLNSYLQALSPRVHLGTILAGNNFVQNILFYCLFIIGFLMSIYMFRTHLVMSIWFLFEFILKLRFSFRYIGLENIPKEKAVLFLSNHISWIDWMIVQFPFRERISFMMDRDIYHWRFAYPFFKLGEAVKK